MSVFDAAVAAAGDFMSAAVVRAAHDLSLAGRAGSLDEIADAIGVGTGRHRLRALLDVLAARGWVVRDDAGRYTCATLPDPVDVPRDGWGRIAEVIRTDRDLGHDGDAARYQPHLRAAGTPLARWLAGELVRPDSPAIGRPRSRSAAAGGTTCAITMLDIGGGSGVYSAAALDADPRATVTLVELPGVAPVAVDGLARFADRARVVVADAAARAPWPLEGPFTHVLLANVLHGHDAATAARMCSRAARSVAPGGRVVIVELDLDDDRRGPIASLLFALTLAIYTPRGDLPSTRRLACWLEEAGLVEIEVTRPAIAPGMVVVSGFRPATDPGVDAAVSVSGRLERVVGSRPVDGLEAVLPAPLATMLGHVLATEGESTLATQLREHYLVTMPRARDAQLRRGDDPAHALLHVELDWTRLPRLMRVLDALEAILASVGSAAELPRAARTIAELYARTHYGAAMPLLYGNSADLAYFAARGHDPHAAIDRYLTMPLLHELCHFGRTRDALLPLHLDECVAGWLGVHVDREFAYPAIGEDDAIYAAPWLSQVGQAIARAFGPRSVIRAHVGDDRWTNVVPTAFLDHAARLGWSDWLARRSLHLLSDTLAPEPWVALALLCGAGRCPGASTTLAELAGTSLVELAGALRPDPELDRRIVSDGIRAMCLDNHRIEGSFRTRAAVPSSITIDAQRARVTTARRGEVDRIDPRYWLPPDVARRMLDRGHARYALRLETLDAIDDAVAHLLLARPTSTRGRFDLVVE